MDESVRGAATPLSMDPLIDQTELASSIPLASGGGWGRGVATALKSPGGKPQRVSSWLITSPNVAVSVLILLGVALASAWLVMWGRGMARYAPGQVASETRASRVNFDLVDKTATESDRQLARSRAPRVYVADEQVFADLRAALKNLPRAVAEASSLQDVTPELRSQFGLTEAALIELKDLSKDAAGLERFGDHVDRLESILRLRPIVEARAFELQQLAQSLFIEVRGGLERDQEAVTLPANVLARAKGQSAVRTLDQAADEAGFDPALRDVVVQRLVSMERPTYRFDEPLTLTRQDELAKLTPERRVRFATGQVIVLRGEPMTSEKLAWYDAERLAYRRSLQPWQRLMLDVGAGGVGLLTAIGLGATAATFMPRTLRRPRRLGPIALLLVSALLGATLVSYVDPSLAVPASAVAAMFVTALLSVVDDRRGALALGALVALATSVGLDLPIEASAAMLCGVGLAAWRLRAVRYRSSLVGASVLSGVAVGSAGVLLGSLARPITDLAMQQMLLESFIAGFGVMMVGFVLLGVLPLIERVFDITTGLTLIELRDPSQPLLRLLQQRAPGTYNHSVNVATLAEAACEAIGADGLLAYVGGLYHDVGKLHKPEYFVENQTPGINRHDRLTPAMSVLIIVAHVRDGLELAEEYRVPGALRHFIEAHHGTTLVEYFYHRARRAAESAAVGGGGDGGLSGGSSAVAPGLVPAGMPLEIEYRYPGPKPRTKEVAALMVCDAAESAVRTLPDVTPARIDATVRAIAQKRLMDGQFDECDLTLRELNLIVDAVARTLASFHHQRVAYPGGSAAAPAPSRAGGVASRAAVGVG